MSDHLSVSLCPAGGRAAGASGGEGAGAEQEEQAAAGPVGREEHYGRGDPGHEGHAGGQGEEGGRAAEEGTAWHGARRASRGHLGSSVQNRDGLEPSWIILTGVP